MAKVPLRLAPVVVVVLGWWAGLGRSDFASDRAECADQLVALATCLPYAEGSAKVPTPDCCSGLKGLVSSSPKCLCILVKDRNDPQLGLKIDAQRALSLPTVCSSSANVTDCPRMLHLKPNSTEAQVFKVGGAAQGSITSSGNVKGNSTSSGKSNESQTGGTSPHYWGGIGWLGLGGLVLLQLHGC